MAQATPYDDVYRTMANDRPGLLIPVVNEAFQENYTKEEAVVLGKSEHYLKQQDGREEKRITDSHFTVHGREKTGRYHIESQSTADGSIQQRMYEYDTQIALEDKLLTREELIVQLPESAIIYLRSTKNTPDKLKTTIKTGNGEITYVIPVLKVKNYTVDELFNKKLYFFIPFHVFVYENSFLLYNENEEKLKELLQVFEDIRNRLEMLVDAEEIDEYTKCCLIDMTKKVVENLAAEYDKVKKGVCEAMGGRILDYEAKDIYNAGKGAGLQLGRSEGLQLGRSEGLQLGRSEGLQLGAMNICISLIKDGIITLAEAVKRLGITEEELRAHMQTQEVQ